MSDTLEECLGIGSRVVASAGASDGCSVGVRMGAEILTGPSEVPLVTIVAVTKEGVGCIVVVLTGLLERMWPMVTVPTGCEARVTIGGVSVTVVRVAVGGLSVTVMVVIGDLEGLGGPTLSVPVGRMGDGIHGRCEVQMIVFEVAVVLTVNEAVRAIPSTETMDGITGTAVWPQR